MKSFLRLAAFGLIAVSCLFAQVQTVATGNITSSGSSCTEANSTTNASSNCVVINIPENTATEAITLSNTFSGTAQFEKSADYGATWVAANAQPVPSGAIVTSATGTGTWVINTEGMTKVRVRCSSYSSGTITVFGQSSTAQSTSAIASTGAAAGQVQGPTAVGSADASTTNPVQVGGLDPSNNVQKLHLDATGRTMVVGAVAVGGNGFTLQNPLPTGCFGNPTANSNKGGPVVCDANGNLTVTYRAQVAGTDDPCKAPNVIPSSASFNLTSTTAATVVALSGGLKIYVCGYDATIQGSATTVGTLQFEYGTTTTNPCDTGTTTISGQYQGNITANVPTYLSRSGPGTIFTPTATSNALCAVATGTTIKVTGTVTYVQQ